MSDNANRRDCAAKIEAFMREFPWLKDFVGKREIGFVKVARVDLDLCRRWRHSFSTEYCTFRERISIFDRDGKELIEVGPKTDPPLPKTWYRRHPKPTTWDNYQDTIERALARLGEKAKDAFFVVSVNYRFPNNDNGFVVWDVTVFKAKLNTDIQTGLEFDIEAFRENIRQDLIRVTRGESQ